MSLRKPFQLYAGTAGERRRRRGGGCTDGPGLRCFPLEEYPPPGAHGGVAACQCNSPGACIHLFAGAAAVVKRDSPLVSWQGRPGKAALNRTLLHARAPPPRWSDQTLRGSAAGASAPRCPCPRRARPRARVPARRRRPPTHGRRGLPDAGRVGAPCQVMVPAHIPASMMPAGQARTPTKPETAPIRGASRALPQRGVPCMPALPRWRYDGARRAHATVSSRHAS